MVTPEQVGLIKQLRDAILGWPIDEIISKPEWGKLDFKQSAPYLRATYDIVKQLTPDTLTLLPHALAQSLVDNLRSINNTIHAIANFDLGKNDAQQTWTNLNAQVEENLTAFVRDGAGALIVTALLGSGQDAFISATLSNVSKAQEEIGRIKFDIEEKQREMAQTLTAAKEAAGTIGVSKYTGEFLAEAERLAKVATRWLKAAIGLASITVVIAGGFPFLIHWIGIDLTKTEDLLQFGTSKLVLVALAFTATIWCGRMYKAVQHQIVINRHRANALKTFETFVASTKDDHIKDAVLMETTRSIFALTSSGLLGNDDSTDSGTKVVEIVRAAGAAVASKTGQ